VYAFSIPADTTIPFKQAGTRSGSLVLAAFFNYHVILSESANSPLEV
jgi:hypothetical protein